MEKRRFYEVCFEEMGLRNERVIEDLRALKITRRFMTPKILLDGAKIQTAYYSIDFQNQIFSDLSGKKVYCHETGDALEVCVECPEDDYLTKNELETILVCDYQFHDLPSEIKYQILCLYSEISEEEAFAYAFRTDKALGLLMRKYPNLYAKIMEFRCVRTVFHYTGEWRTFVQISDDIAIVNNMFMLIVKPTHIDFCNLPHKFSTEQESL